MDIRNRLKREVSFEIFQQFFLRNNRRLISLVVVQTEFRTLKQKLPNALTGKTNLSAHFSQCSRFSKKPMNLFQSCHGHSLDIGRFGGRLVVIERCTDYLS